MKRDTADTRRPKAARPNAKITKLVDVHEHRSHAQWCPCCQKVVFAPFPEEIRAAGLSGSGLTALVAYLKEPWHASFSTIRKFFRDLVKLKHSRGPEVLIDVFGKEFDGVLGWRKLETTL